MGRALDREGNCYRHTVVYIFNDNPNDTHTNHFGIYNTTGPAKAKATAWINREGSRITVLDRYTEITSEWTRV